MILSNKLTEALITLDNIPFENTDYRIADNIQLTVVDIKELTEECKAAIDKYLIKICSGPFKQTTLKRQKKCLLNLFNSKTKDTHLRFVKGASAEFIIHLILNMIGFKQECLFRNLEENSIKKGFDGYYSLNNDTWIMESKSGLKDINTHSYKLREAIKGITDMIAGNTSNNPWANAYNHALHVNLQENSLVKNLNDLENEYVDGVFHDIKEFNVIPCSTLYLNGTWTPQDHNAIAEEVKQIIPYLNGKKIKIFCVTQNTVTLFYDYIKESEKSD